MLKFGFALSTDKDPFGHLSPRTGDSQNAGEHPQGLCANVQKERLRNNQVLFVAELKTQSRPALMP